MIWARTLSLRWSLTIFYFIEVATAALLKLEDTNPSLIDILKLKAIENNQGVNIEIEDFEDDKAPGIIGKTKVLVKRLVPKGHQASAIEYDKRSDTYFKPLLKIHRGSKYESNNDVHRHGDRSLKRHRNKKPVFKGDLLTDVVDLFTAVNTNAQLNGYRDSDVELLKQVVVLYKTVKQQALSTAPQKAKPDWEGPRTLNELVASIRAKKRADQSKLRTMAEANDGRSSENLTQGMNDGQELEVVPKPATKVWLPTLPFWNYWTYKKTIVHDDCPGDSVRVNGLCLWTPPH